MPQVKAILGVPSDADRNAFAKNADRLLVEPFFVSVKVPGLHQRVARVYPVVNDQETERAVYEFGWLAGTGTGILLAALVSAAWMRIPVRTVVQIFLQTCYRVRWPMFTIACMLAIAFTTRYSGMDAHTGVGVHEDRIPVSSVRRTPRLAGEWPSPVQIHRRTRCSVACKRSPRGNWWLHTCCRSPNIRQCC